ncbi:MAG: M50 family metallopeptidase [Candidatus Saccharibacteria bacterium]
MELFFGIITGLLILAALVVAHELGHAIAARRNGVVVEEFGVGFPPSAFKKKLKSGTVFSLNWIPLGGFVKLQGEYDSARKKGDYGAVSFRQKTKILLSGVAVNWLLAALLLTVLALTGLPKVLPNQVSVLGDTTIVNQPVEITALTKDYPAQKSGFKVGDKIIRFAGYEVPTADRLIEISKQKKGQSVAVIYNRKGVEYNKNVTLRNSSSGGLFGASLGQREMIKSTWSAPIVGVATTAQFSWLTLQGVGQLIGDLTSGLVSQLNPNSAIREQASKDLNKVGDSVAGPIGILGTIFPAAQQAGLTQLIFLTAIISLSLAVMNILPIPSLDGGRWLTMALFKLFKKKLTKKREERIQTIGFSILMCLVILVTFADVSKLF